MAVEARDLACRLWMSTSESTYRRSLGPQGQSTGWGSAHFRGPVGGSWGGGLGVLAYRLWMSMSQSTCRRFLRLGPQELSQQQSTCRRSLKCGSLGLSLQIVDELFAEHM